MNTISKTVSDYIKILGVRVTCSSAGFDNSPSWQADKWRFTLSNGAKKVRFTYRTGVGHRVLNMPVTPLVAGLIYSLLLDASAIDESFAGWCDNYGYSDDSRQAMRTYRACVKNGAKLSTIFNSEQLAHLQTLLQDY